MAEDLSIYFAGTPYLLTVGGVSKPCLFTEGDEITLQASGAGQIAAQAVATVITADFPGIKGGDACSVALAKDDGTTSELGNFTVWRRLRIQDGGITEILLKRG